MARHRRSAPKRTLSEEQLAKMQEGRRKAMEEREKTRERVELLADLDARLAEGRRNAERTVYLPKHRPRRRHTY